ncbi:hypothetical protein JTB14_037984 [Gonioctena quinquepunctata]|nr:hypothetical protein JTB14_037984 [Gonioctena quinquepunctata]
MPRSWTYPTEQNEPEPLLQGLRFLPTVRRANASLLDLCYKKNEPELLLQCLNVLPTFRRAIASLLDLSYGLVIHTPKVVLFGGTLTPQEVYRPGRKILSSPVQGYSII